MRTIRSTLLVTSVLALAFGCAPSNPGLVAEGVLSSDTMCLVSPTNAFLGEGSLDLYVPDVAAYRPYGLQYSVAYRVANQLINNANRGYPLMADPDRIVINQAEVTLQDGAQQTLSLPGLPNPYLVPASGAIASTESMEPTLGIAGATVIPDAYGRALAARFTSGGTLVVSTRIIGTTAGGATLTSGPVVFVINMCVGCLYRPSCDAMGNGILALSCQPGQDGISLIPPSGPCPTI